MQLELFNLEDYKNPPIQLEDVFQAYFDCRKNKRSTYNALAFETNYEENLVTLWKEIVSGKYNPGRSIAFIVTKPVKREVFAADFRDRVVHHLVSNGAHGRIYQFVRHAESGNGEKRPGAT